MLEQLVSERLNYHLDVIYTLPTVVGSVTRLTRVVPPSLPQLHASHIPTHALGLHYNPTLYIYVVYAVYAERYYREI